MREEITMRIGYGYDVHRLVEGRRLILGGVDIPWEKGLLGHSDADVLTHALMDALLGAAALGDIGQHFPDKDPAYEGADSVELLRHVCGSTAGVSAMWTAPSSPSARSSCPISPPCASGLPPPWRSRWTVSASRPPQRKGWAFPARGWALRPTPWRCWKTNNTSLSRA